MVQQTTQEEPAVEPEAEQAFQEDVAPAVRQRQLLEAEMQRRLEEEQRIQKLIEEEKERDPDALEEEARQKVYKE